MEDITESRHAVATCTKARETMQPRLPIFEIVEEWHSSRSDNRSPDGLLLWLVQAMWSGDLALYAPSSETPTSRETFLKGLREVAAGSGIGFYEAAPPEQITADDQGGFVYLDETQVVLLEKVSAWTPDLLNRAYAILGDAPLAHYPQQFLSAFRAHETMREEFGSLCDKRDWDRPSFWFSRAVRKTRRADVVRCRTWLATLATGSKEHSKAYYRREAGRRYGVSGNRFDQIWADMVGPGFKRSGAPRKSKRR